MNSGFYPQVVNPKFRRVQTESNALQKPFYFGGSQVPSDLGLPNQSFSGAGFHKDSPSKTHKGDLDFTTKLGNKVYHQKGHFVVKPYNKPYVK